MKVQLTVSSLKDAEKKLRDAAKKLEAAPDRIIDKLLEIGDAEANLHIITDEDNADGNEDVYTEIVTVIGAGKLNMEGSDGAYQEFGTGLIGQFNPNPKQPPSYQHSNKTIWFYDYDRATKTSKVSHGMPAQMPMYNASKAIREALPAVARKEVEECLKSLR